VFKVLYVGSSSACFELQNNLIYYSEREYFVTVDGKSDGKARRENVFSLFNLKPATKYRVGTAPDGFSLEIETPAESACLDARSFGAVGDGATNDWRAIQTAIDCCPKNGRVLISGGVFYTSPIVLKSHMTLEIAGGAKLLASENAADYPVLPGEVECAGSGGALQCATWEGEPRACYRSFISAFHAEDICVTGEGAVDGNGGGGGWYADCKGQSIARPRLMFINGCKNFTVHGLAAGNSASWHYHPFFSKNVNFYDIRVTADRASPNTDGCNPESCDGVKIIGAAFSTGDDCIAVKSGKAYMGAKYRTPCKNITVRNCLMRFGHGGVTLGSEMSGGIKNLDVSRCFFSQTDRGLRIKTRRGRGKYGIIDNVKFESVRMENVLTPLVVNMFYCCDADGLTEYVQSRGKRPADDGAPYLGRFRFKDMDCTDCEYAAGFFCGLPERPVKEISIENARFSMKGDAGSGVPAMASFIGEHSKAGLLFTNVETVKLKNVTFSGVSGGEVVTDNVDNLITENVTKCDGLITDNVKTS
jgi:polygalacturonase